MNTYSAILPIKFNSERVPGKNFRLLNGKPLYLHILHTLLDVSKISEIVINTDTPIKEFGGLFEDSRLIYSSRPSDLCGEYVSMNDIISYELKRSSSNYFFMTHTTNPLLRSETITRLLFEFESLGQDQDSVVSVTEYFGRFLSLDGTPLNHNPQQLLRTQDLKPVLFENSCGYVFSKHSFLESNSRIGLNPKFVSTPKIESIDIDDEEDFFIAESIVRRLDV